MEYLGEPIPYFAALLKIFLLLNEKRRSP